MRYQILKHDGDNWGVHYQNGQIISDHDNFKAANAAMERYIAGDKRRKAKKKGKGRKTNPALP